MVLFSKKYFKTKDTDKFNLSVSFVFFSFYCIFLISSTVVLSI